MSEQPPVALLDQADQRMRCGEVWGTGCRAWVCPPAYAHDNGRARHPSGDHMALQAARSADLDVSQRERLATAIVAASTTHVDVLTLCSIRGLSPQWFMDTHANKRLGPGPPAVIDRALAENADCPPDLLHELATSDSPMVRWAVVRHPQVHGPTLAILVNDSDPDVRRYARGHPKLPPEYQELLRATE